MMASLRFGGGGGLGVLAVLSSVGLLLGEPTFVWQVDEGSTATLSERNVPILTYQLAPRSLEGRATHPNYPLRWILRERSSMQNAQWPGRRPVPLSRAMPLHLRYRMVIHRGDLALSELRMIWKHYAEDESGRQD